MEINYGKKVWEKEKWKLMWSEVIVNVERKSILKKRRKD